MRTIEPSELPMEWRHSPAPGVLQELGTAWVRAGETALLSVPAVAVPRERNLILNLAHPDLAALRVLPPEPFSFDPRMWKRR